MVAEIISVGTELLLGNIVNTNAQYIANEMAKLGIDLYYQSVVGDNEERLSNVLRTALERSDLIITTGGLGPTKDDLTKEVAASYFGKQLCLSFLRPQAFWPCNQKNAQKAIPFDLFLLYLHL